MQEVDSSEIMVLLYQTAWCHISENLTYHNICFVCQVYLKEILKEVCNYNLKNPHKNMWELKPEYRHYKDQVPAPASTDN